MKKGIAQYLFLMKSHVKAHERMGKNGNLEMVREYDDSRLKKVVPHPAARTKKQAEPAKKRTGQANVGAARPQARQGYPQRPKTSQEATSTAVPQKIETPAYGWPPDFPNVLIQTTGSRLKGHPDYAKAKKGDRNAALNVVESLCKLDRIQELAARHPNATVVPVHEVEQDGINRLPEAYAEYIGAFGNLKVDDNIVKTNKTGHTGSDGIHRMVHRAKFTGKVQHGREYILVDDYTTQGGTLSELRQYIERNGGKVVEVTSLAAAQGSTVLALKQETLQKLKEAFGHEELAKFLKEHGIYGGNPEALTNSEAGQLLKYRKQGLVGARDKFATARS